MSRSKIAVVLTFALMTLLSVSCATTSQVDPQAANDRLSAEHSQMKRRMPLLERENEVLKEESLQFRLKVRKLEAGTQQLSSDLARLSQQHEQAIELGQAQSRDLQERMEQQQQASAEAINTLTGLNQSLAQQLSADRREFNTQLAAQRSDFKQQMERVKKENAKTQGDLHTRIDGLEKSLAGREAEINSLTKRVDELSAGLDAAGKEIVRISQSRIDLQNEFYGRISKLEKTLAGSAAENESLKKKVIQFSSGLDAAGKEIDQINQIRAAMQKELEMAKADKNELLKQLNQLSDELKKQRESALR